jgi:hypothetical protein
MSATTHVPASLVIHCHTEEQAKHIAHAVKCTLENLLHECDVIMRVPPTIHETERDPSDPVRPLFYVRARFTAKPKPPQAPSGQIIMVAGDAPYTGPIDET